MELSKKERWILSNQYLILERLYPDDAEVYSQRRQIIQSGYEAHYDWITEYIQDPITADQTSEVMDILQMHEALQDAYSILQDREGISERDIQFQGFDGNQEAELLGYTQFLVHRENRFPSLGRVLNSHIPCLTRYRRMLQEWNLSANKANLTKEDIIRITSAR